MGIDRERDREIVSRKERDREGERETAPRRTLRPGVKQLVLHFMAFNVVMVSGN